MAVLLKNGAVFLHVPKTGGTWVTRVLYDLELVEQEFGHQHADMIRVLHADKFPSGKSSRGDFNSSLKRQIEVSTYKFCFVRHPLRWYESWWKYMQEKKWIEWGQPDNKNRWHPCLALNNKGHSDFRVFIENVLAAHPGFVTEMYSRYTDHGIHFVGKQENLVEDLIHVLQSLEVRVDPKYIRRIPLTNVSSELQIPMCWAENIRARVQQLEFAGLLRYGYASAEGVSW